MGIELVKIKVRIREWKKEVCFFCDGAGRIGEHVVVDEDGNPLYMSYIACGNCGGTGLYARKLS